jgi:serine acetyltransferase
MWSGQRRSGPIFPSNVGDFRPGRIILLRGSLGTGLMLIRHHVEIVVGRAAVLRRHVAIRVRIPIGHGTTVVKRVERADLLQNSR